MSVRENIQIFHPFDLDTYLEILRADYGACEYPNQPGSYLIEDLPFYKPKWIEDHVSILGFNYVPLSELLIQALVNHTDLVPDEAIILWLIEQELLLTTTLTQMRNK